MAGTTTASKRRTNISVSGDLLDAARAHDLNVSAIAEAALAEAVAAARRQAWLEDNREALALRRAWIERNGLPLARWQSWQPG